MGGFAAGDLDGIPGVFRCFAKRGVWIEDVATGKRWSIMSGDLLGQGHGVMVITTNDHPRHHVRQRAYNTVASTYATPSCRRHSCFVEAWWLQFVMQRASDVMTRNFASGHANARDL